MATVRFLSLGAEEDGMAFCRIEESNGAQASFIFLSRKSKYHFHAVFRNMDLRIPPDIANINASCAGEIIPREESGSLYE
jgi:hypothetical protein